MFQGLKRLKLRFSRKKVPKVSLDELIVTALDEAKNYPLIQDNDDLAELFKNKFKTPNGAQVPPVEFITKIITFIEKSPPLSIEEFAVFVRATIAAVPPPDKKKKFRFWKK